MRALEEQPIIYGRIRSAFVDS
ncbi:hypothetical protein MTBUT4_20025 [Magnetospirillum sp. UT-4]|nr:hypothetical protein MTBUT4_20025 [Magnetospirillum sp. UT-4]